MPAIKISELRPAGSELFKDSENFLYELTDHEIVVVAGGSAPININVTNVNVGSINIVSVFTANGNTINANTVGNVNTHVG